MVSERTKSLKRKTTIFGLLSYITWIGVALFFVFAALLTFDKTGSDGKPIFSEEFKAMLISIGITTGIGILMAVIIKEKIRTFVWIACTILASIIYKEVGMYIVLSLWLIDEYIFTNLYKHYKNKFTINKEIDLRG